MVKNYDYWGDLYRGDYGKGNPYFNFKKLHDGGFPDLKSVFSDFVKNYNWDGGSLEGKVLDENSRRHLEYLRKIANGSMLGEIKGNHSEFLRDVQYAGVDPSESSSYSKVKSGLLRKHFEKFREENENGIDLRVYSSEGVGIIFYKLFNYSKDQINGS